MPSMDREDLDEANRRGGVEKTFGPEIQPYVDAAREVLGEAPFEPSDRLIFDMRMSAYTRTMMILALVDAGYWRPEDTDYARTELNKRLLFITEELTRRGIAPKTV